MKPEGVDISAIIHELGGGGDTEDGFDATGRWQNIYIGAVKTKVYFKIFTGVTDADATTVIAHGMTDHHKIIGVYPVIERTASNTFYVPALEDYGVLWACYWNATNITLGDVRVDYQSSIYWLFMIYSVDAI